MAPKPTGVLTWDVTEIARVLKVEPRDVHEYFTDGRRVSFLLERRLAREVIKGTLAPSEGAGFDLIDPSGKKWEVRSVTKGGIYFCPSYMVGSGRAFNEPGFLRKLKEIEGYIVSDVESFPNIPFWIIWAAPGFPDTWLRCNDALGGVRWEDGYTTGSSSLRQ